MLSWLVAKLSETTGVALYGLLCAFVFADATPVLGALLPGEAPLLVAGVLGGRGALSPWLAGGLAAGAAIAGDSLNYWVGRVLGKERVTRWGSKVGLSAELVDNAGDFLERHGRKAVFGGRFASALRAFVPLAAGVTGYSYRKFLSANLPAGLIWATLFISLGYAAGDNWRMVATWVDRIGLTLVAALAVWLLFKIAAQRKKRREARGR